MMKLFKYNWKMNSLGFYIVLALTAVLYVLMLIGKYQWGWIDELVFSFGIALAALSSLVFLVLACLSFNHGLKSYHRRLIPLNPLAEVGAVLLLAIIYALVSAVLAILYFLILNASFPNTTFDATLATMLRPQSLAVVLLMLVWSTITFTALVMLAITTSYCFRGKYRAWIGVLVFIAFPLLIDYATSFIVGPDFNHYFSLMRFEVNSQGQLENGIIMPGTVRFWSLPALIEAIVLAIQLAIIHYLMKKRIQL